MKDLLYSRIVKIEEIAKNDMKLDYYPINYEIVPQETMLEVISYGLPTRARHWSYGQSYEYQKMQGEMGFSKVYEVVLNNNPSYAFLLDTNSDIANTMVAAHVIGHVHFFKNNFLFKKTDNKMVYHAAERAQRIEEYIQKYGLEAVERIMDIGFALDKHIDWHKGSARSKYQRKEKFYKESKKDEFDDLHESEEFSLKEVRDSGLLPPSDEYDIIWFLTNYSKDLEPWQKDVLEIIREESYYFYPQYMTKIMNEGFASFCHAELMLKFDDIPQSEYMDFCKIHEKVVQPGANKLSINPYFLGFTIFNDIRERWNKLHKDGESDIDGMQKIYEVVATEDDISFIRNYLTEEIAKDLKLFSYKSLRTNDGGEAVHILAKEIDRVREAIVKDLYHYRAPLICITSIEDGVLQLQHKSTNIGTLDEKYAEHVLGYIFELWRRPVNLETKDEEGHSVHFTFDELGFGG
jgi:stage V sporulation protein R